MIINPKLAFTMDGRSEEEREHLWFEVHALDSTTVEATCLNAPYHVTELREGQRGRYPLERLSDFAVLSPLGQVGPDHIRIVETVANDEEALHQLAKVGDTT